MTNAIPSERLRNLEAIGNSTTYLASGFEVGWSGWWSYGPIGAAAVTVISATDLCTVQQIMRIKFVVHEIAGGGTNGNTVNATPGGGAVNLYNAGADTLTLTIGAGGDVTVQRAAGASTYNVVLEMTWI
jgi:hypothetical protein